MSNVYVWRSTLKVSLKKQENLNSNFISEQEANLMEYEVQVQTLQADLEIVQEFKVHRTISFPSF